MATNDFKCACGATAIMTAVVKFPGRVVEEYCDRGCPDYLAAMKRADREWSAWRANRAAGDVGRAQALAAKAARPKPGSAEAIALAAKKAVARRGRQLARAAKSAAARGKGGGK